MNEAKQRDQSEYRIIVPNFYSSISVRMTKRPELVSMNTEGRQAI